MKKQPINKNVLQSKLTAMLAVLLLCFTHLQVQAQWGFNSRRYRLGDAAKSESGNATKSGSWTNSDGTWNYCQTSGGGLRITSYQGSAKSVSTPARINGMSVSHIGGRAFAGTSIEKIVISEGVWAIEDSAFRGCQSITEITLPKSLRSSYLSNYLFNYCTNLRCLIVPLSLKDGVRAPRHVKVFHYEKEPSEIDIKAEMDKIERNRVHHVFFDSEKGRGRMAAIPFKIGDKIQLPENEFKDPSGASHAGRQNSTPRWEFEGWATNKTGSAVFADRSEVQFNKDMTLYPIWRRLYYIRFEANGGDGRMQPVLIKKGAPIKLPPNTYKCELRPGRKYRMPDEKNIVLFAGWATAPNANSIKYADEAEFVFDADNDVTLYAKWIDGCEVSFMPNAFGVGEQMPNMKMPANEPFDLNTNSYVREGYEFKGWALEPDGDVKFKDGANVSFGHGTVLLYAKWSDMQNYHVVLHANNYNETYYELNGKETDKYMGNRRHRLVDRGEPNDGKIELLISRGTEKSLPADRFVCSPRELGGKFLVFSKLELAGWAKEREGEVCYTNGAAIKPNDDMHLYAVWQPCADIDIQDGTLCRANLNRLKSFELPANVTNISCRWSGARNITEFRVHPDNPVYSAKDGFLLNKSGEKVLVLMIPSENIAIPKGVKEIGKHFIDNSLYMYEHKPRCEITSVSLPDGVVSINDDAFTIDHYHEFSRCYHLTRIDLPDTLKNIGNSAFKGCAELAEVKIPVGTTNIGERAFSGCKEIARIDIPASVASVGKYAFEECDALSELSIPNGMTKIGEYAFYRCTSITNVAISFQTMTNNVERGLFYSNDNMTMSVDMGDGKILNVSSKTVREYGVGKGLCDYIEFQTRRNDAAYKFPADSFCDAHPALYKDFCAGASEKWCRHRLSELRNEQLSSSQYREQNSLQFNYDDKLKILSEVVVQFPAPGVSLDALVAKYKRNSKGEFKFNREIVESMGDSKEVFKQKMSRLKDPTKKHFSVLDKARMQNEQRQMVDALLGGYEKSRITMGDDDVCVSFIICDTWGIAGAKMSQDSYSRSYENNSEAGIKTITIRSRRLDAALAERNKMEKAAKAKAEANAARKKEADALDF